MKKTVSEIKAKVAEKFAALSIPQILEMWKMTNERNDTGIPEVRGWIMDELEKRCPKAFDIWMMADGAPEPNSFFRED